MGIKSRENTVGAWAFLIGVIIAILIGVFTVIIPVDWISSYNAQIYALLSLLGLFVGAMIKGKDSKTFLLSGAILVIVSRFGMDGVKGSLIGISIGDAVTTIFGALLTLFIPAVIVVAIKSVFDSTNL
jgi:hypothetical protein